MEGGPHGHQQFVAPTGDTWQLLCVRTHPGSKAIVRVSYPDSSVDSEPAQGIHDIHGCLGLPLHRGPPLACIFQ